MKEIFVAYIIGIISKDIIKWWLGHNQEIKAKLTNADDQFETYLTNKLNIKLPEQAHQAYDWLVTTLVDTINKNVGDGAFLRQVMRAIYKKDASQQTVLLAQMEKFAGDLVNGVLENLPTELKGLVNEEKQLLTVRVLSNKIVTAIPSIKKTEEEIKKDVNAAASANKINEMEGPITKEDLLKAIEDSKKRQEALANHK